MVGWAPDGSAAMDNLADKLLDLIEPGDADDFFALKNLLSIAASALPVNGTLPSDDKQLTAFRLVQDCLYRLRRPLRPRLTLDGVLWHGRPAFVTDAVLRSLTDDARLARRVAQRQKWGQFISPGGPVVAAFTKCDELRTFIENLVGDVDEFGVASCLYYDEIDAHIRPHVDTDNFCVNANLMLEHESFGRRTSNLIVYPVGGQPKQIALKPGEMVVMYADCIVHTRTPVSDGERVMNITFGYKPKSEVHESILS